jgi:hypothetical protein
VSSFLVRAALLIAPMGVLSAASASGSLALAKWAAGRELLRAGTSSRDTALPDRESPQLPGQS